ncbi:MAG: flagellin [Sulfurimonas sp.]|nr:flagellin [Sulfurimonas sp.]
MSFSINSNIGSQQSNFYANQNQNNLNKTLSALSSADKLSSAATDAASLAISEKLLALISGSGQAIQNANESIGLIQVADGALLGIEDNTQRIRTLTLQASNDTLNDGDRAIIQQEIDSLSESSEDIATSTSYNGIKLLDGSGGSRGNGTFVTQNGPDSGDTHSVSIGDARASTLIGNIDVTTQAGRDTALTSLDGGLKEISNIRANLGAAQNGLASSIRNTSVSQINAASAASQLRDVDFALESANFSRQNIFTQTGTFAQAQGNANKSNLVGLLG